MLTIFLLLINITTIFLGIFFFDYRVDNAVNNPLVMILSIIAGTIIMLGFAALYIELLYRLVAKKRPVNDMLVHRIANEFMAIPLIATNTRIKVEGIENLPKDPGFTIYSNHTSMMDIPVLMVKFKKYPVGFLAKQMVGNLFAVGKWAKAIGCVLIDRTSSRKGAESIIKVIKYVKNGSSMVIFPEGTRTREAGKMIDFKPGSFRVALKTKKPLVPISIVKSKGYRNIKWPLPKRMKIVVHKPLEFEDYKALNTQELSQKVREIIQEPLKDIGE